MEDGNRSKQGCALISAAGFGLAVGVPDVEAFAGSGRFRAAPRRCITTVPDAH
jgi:hypothetical protein